MKYRELKKYKYQLMEDFVFPPLTDFLGKSKSGWIEMSPKRGLLIYKGYAWDGPSGPTIDTKNFLRGSLVHDALYQLMREGLLPQSYRQEADEILRRICIEDGMSAFRARYVYLAVRLFAASAAEEPIEIPPILEAP